jgi:hypothetical protein
MEQERGDGGRRGEMSKHVQAHPQPQKCPRCDSFNTKFCYYNNYSLSQPRFFCKTCRRYWTQGGTLRNVPIGGGCRKGKKSKTSSSTPSSNSLGNSSLSRPTLPQSTDQLTMAAMAKNSSSVFASFSSAASFYQGGVVGYMSPFAAFNHSLNSNPSTHSSAHTFEQSQNVGVGVGVGLGSSSNLSLLQGFNVAAAALVSSSQGPNRPPPQQFFQLGGNGGPMFTSEPRGLNLIPPSSMVNATTSVATDSATYNESWPQSFINSGNNRASDQSLWSTINTTSTNGGGNSERIGVGAGAGGSRGAGGSGGVAAGGSGSASLALNQWHDLSGFNPPQ